MIETSTSYLTTAKGKLTLRFVLISFIAGAIAGTTGDFVHVITKTDGYPAHGPFPFLPFLPVNMPIWVPLLFGTAVMLMAGTHKIVSPMFQPRLANRRQLALIAPFFFVFVYACTGFIQAGKGWQDAWIATTAILLWWFADRTVTGALLALLNAVIGTFFEIFLVGIGGFFYYPEHSGLFGVPTWLPWLYMCASICISLFVRWI